MVLLALSQVAIIRSDNSGWAGLSTDRQKQGHLTSCLESKLESKTSESTWSR